MPSLQSFATTYQNQPRLPRLPPTPFAMQRLPQLAKEPMRAFKDTNLAMHRASPGFHVREQLKSDSYRQLSTAVALKRRRHVRPAELRSCPHTPGQVSLS